MSYGEELFDWISKVQVSFLRVKIYWMRPLPHELFSPNSFDRNPERVLTIYSSSKIGQQNLWGRHNPSGLEGKRSEVVP